MAKNNTSRNIAIGVLSALLLISLFLNIKQNDDVANLRIENETLQSQTADPIPEKDASLTQYQTQIEQLTLKNQELEKTNAEYLSTNTDLGTLRDSLYWQISQLKAEITDLKETYIVFYVDNEGKEIYSEEVKKGEAVQNAPTAPEKSNFHVEWSSDGNNIQKSQVIYPRYYHELTFISEQVDDKDVAHLSTNLYKLYQDTATAVFTYSTISINDEVIVTATINNTDFPTYNTSGWYINGGTEMYHNYGGSTMEFEITGDTAFTLTAYYGCVVKGSKIAMADGTEKNVEDLQIGDMLLSYDYRAGNIQAKKLLAVVSGANIGRVFDVQLENGQNLKIVDIEFLFDTDEKIFMPVNVNTYDSLVGRNVMINNNGEIGSSKIVSVNMTTEYTEHYTLYTEDSIDYIANGVVALTETYYPNLRYTIGDDFKVDQTQYSADIAQYGLYTAADFADVISEELFYAWHLQDMSIVVGKGYATIDGLREAFRIAQEEYDNFINSL